MYFFSYYWSALLDEYITSALLSYLNFIRHAYCIFQNLWIKLIFFSYLMFCYCLIPCNCDRFPDIAERTDRLGCASNICPCDVFTCLSYWRTICCDKRSNSINTSSHSMRSRCRQTYLWLVHPRKGWEHYYTILWQTIHTQLSDFSFSSHPSGLCKSGTQMCFCCSSFFLEGLKSKCWLSVYKVYHAVWCIFKNMYLMFNRIFQCFFNCKTTFPYKNSFFW